MITDDGLGDGRVPADHSVSSHTNSTVRALSTIYQSTGDGGGDANENDHGGYYTATATNLSQRSIRPSFPSSAPAVFRDPETAVVSSKQLDMSEYADALKVLRDFEVPVAPPRLYIRAVAYRSTANKSGRDAKPSADYENGFDRVCRDMGRVILFDSKFELTQYVDSEFFMYGPDSVLGFRKDRQHKYKQLAIFKYISSSKLKSLCIMLKEKYAMEFDSFNLTILNTDHSAKYPRDPASIFFRTGCSNLLRWSLALLVPILIPWILIEYSQHHVYECGFVYRIQRKSFMAIEEELTEFLDETIQQYRQSNPSSEKPIILRSSTL